MKKQMLICLSFLLIVVCLIDVYAGQSSIMVGEEGLIEKAREEISNLAEVDTIEMTVADKSTIENNRNLLWIITGNKYRMNRYYPLEVIETSKDEYEFVHLHNCGTQRGQDIYFELFSGGYSFVINNPKGNTIWNTKCGETHITWASHFLFKLCRKGGQSLYERKK